MKTVTQADVLKVMQDAQGKITKIQQTASVQQITNETRKEALKNEQMTEGVVDAVTAKFTLFEQQTKNQQELTQGVKSHRKHCRRHFCFSCRLDSAIQTT